MLPRLHRLRDDLPDIDLRIQTADRDLDIRTEAIELGVRGGRPEDWPDYDSALIAPEIIEAVASAAYSKSMVSRKLSPTSPSTG
jgi:DNA-binding transcriptional LysR family regulator